MEGMAPRQPQEGEPGWLEDKHWDVNTGEPLDRSGMLTAIRQEQAAVGSLCFQSRSFVGRGPVIEFSEVAGLRLAGVVPTA